MNSIKTNNQYKTINTNLRIKFAFIPMKQFSFFSFGPFKKASPSLTIIAVSDTVLEDSVPLLLLFLSHHAEVVVMGVGMPEDQRELGGALKEW